MVSLINMACLEPKVDPKTVNVTGALSYKMNEYSLIWAPSRSFDLQIPPESLYYVTVTTQHSRQASRPGHRQQIDRTIGKRPITFKANQSEEWRGKTKEILDHCSQFTESLLGYWRAFLHTALRAPPCAAPPPVTLQFS